MFEGQSIPTIEFSDWFRQCNRKSIPGKNLPGVYLIARFEDQEPPVGSADALDSSIVYIGETSKKLSDRLRSFSNTVDSIPRNNLGKHPGGLTYLDEFGPNEERAIYLSVMPSSHLQWDEWDEEQLAAKYSMPIAKIRRLLKGWETEASAKDKGPKNRAWVKFVERKLLLDFVMKWDNLPKCNKE